MTSGNHTFQTQSTSVRRQFSTATDSYDITSCKNEILAAKMLYKKVKAFCNFLSLMQQYKSRELKSLIPIMSEDPNVDNY